MRDSVEHHLRNHDEQIQAIFEAIRQLMAKPEPGRKKIGFHLKERHSPYMARVKKDSQINLIHSNIIVV